MALLKPKAQNIDPFILRQRHDAVGRKAGDDEVIESFVHQMGDAFGIGSDSARRRWRAAGALGRQINDIAHDSTAAML